MKFSSQFHRYSTGRFGNGLLIMLQDSQATHVAGHQAFKAMGRQVRRGEAGIKVLAPDTRREPRVDDAGRPLRDDRGRVLYRTQVVATKPVTVFDIRQTDGPPLPDPKIGEATLVTGQAPTGLWDRLQDLLEERGFDVRRGPDLGGSNGYIDFARRLVMVRDDVDDAQAVKTLAHEEVGHVVLHQDRLSVDCRGILEVEAESVALTWSPEHTAWTPASAPSTMSRVGPSTRRLNSATWPTSCAAASGRLLRRQCRHPSATHRGREAPGITLRREVHPRPC